MEGEETTEGGGDQVDTTPSIATQFESAAEETGLSFLSSALNSESEVSESGWSNSIDSSVSSESSVDSVPTMTEVKIGGATIKLAATAREALADETPMFKKGDRKGLSEDKRNDLFEKATKHVLTKFDLLSMSIKDEDKLDETYNVHILLTKMRTHMVKYDMHDVFTVLNVSDDGKEISSEIKSLFENYPTITEAEVAKSNKWYNTWPEEVTFRENLQLTFQFLENNTTERLWDKCMEAYEKYEAAEKGGPLMFIIMMKKLQVDTDAAVQYLQTTIKQLKITNFDGENVSRVVSLIRGAYKRLKGVGDSKVPIDFSKQIAMVLQTSTVPEFNLIFQHFSNMVEIKQSLEPGKDHWPSPDKLLDMAENKYLELHHIDKWTGVNTKVNQSVFNASNRRTPPAYKCFNCGGNHLLTECTVIKDEARIERNREAFLKEKREKRAANKDKKNKTGNPSNNATNTTSGGKSGKFAPPTASENNRRLIDGKWWKYNAGKSRWFIDKKKNREAGIASAKTAQDGSTNTTPPPTTVSTISSGNSVATARDAVRDAAMSNAQHAINLAVRGVVDAYRDTA